MPLPQAQCTDVRLRSQPVHRNDIVTPYVWLWRERFRAPLVSSSGTPVAPVRRRPNSGGSSRGRLDLLHGAGYRHVDNRIADTGARGRRAERAAESPPTVRT